MSVSLSNDKNDLVNKVAKSLGFDNFRVKVTSGSTKGDGYLGIINTIEVEDFNKPNKILHLILKSAMTEKKLREVAPVRKAYEREIYLYETIFPLLRKFSEEVGIKSVFRETAKCYGSLLIDQEECLLLENLREIDFKLWNRKVPMNEEHVALVFATYAKFHGAGLALKILRPEKFEEISKNCVNIFYKEEESEEEKKRSMDNFTEIFKNGFRAVANNENLTQALAKFAENALKFFLEDVRKTDKFSTILHGDCWCNNMMFKYDDLKNPLKPTDMCFLDWQISQIGSPILDLSYFFYACSSKEVLYNLKKFLRIYHQQLSTVMKEAGIDSDKIFSYEEIEEQWKIYSKYGLFMTFLVMKIILSEIEEAPDLSELAKSGKNILESVNATESINIEAVNERISNVVNYMHEQNYL